VSDCPVCGKAGVEETAIRCPQCHADLECFSLLDALHEGEPAPAVQEDLAEVKRALGRLEEAVLRGGAGSGRRWGRPVLAAVVGLAALILVTHFPADDHPPAEPPVRSLDQAKTRGPEPVATGAAVEAVAGGIERLAGHLGVIEERLDTLAADQAKTFEKASEIAAPVLGIRDQLGRLAMTVAPLAQEATADKSAAPVEAGPKRVLHHHRRPGETLWSVAKRYYGRGLLYPVLIAQNPGVGPYDSGTGVLRIAADLDEAEAVYRHITPPGAQGRLFRYRVEPGDDWSELAKRFLGRPSRAPELIALNPGRDLLAGEQVLIPLE